MVMVMMAFILATDFDFIAYMSKMAFSFFFFFFGGGGGRFFTPMSFLEYDYIYKPKNVPERETTRMFPNS